VLANHEGRRSIIELDYDGLFLREIRLGDASGNDVGQKFASIAVSPSGERIYVTDSQDMKLWIADRDGRILAAIDLAQDLTEDDRSDTILGKVDVYADTVLMAAPGAGVVRLYDLDGGERGFIGTQGTTPCNLAFPVAAAMDDEGHIWIVDQQRMVYSRWSIEEDRCLEEYFGPGNLPGYLYYPLDLALDASGRLYVSQGFEGRVQSYTGAPAAARNEEPSPSE